MNKQIINRTLIYIAGLLILALGIILNTKAGLGVSPIISVAYSISRINDFNFGNTTLGLYTLFVIIEIVIHTVKNISSRRNSDNVLAPANKNSLKFIILTDVLQIPLSIVFTRFMNLFADNIPDFSPKGTNTLPHFCLQLLVLLAALVFTGIGAVMSLNMRIVPNPGDGIVQAISDCIHKSVGFTKNCFDLFNVSLTVCIGLISTGHLIGIGIGTVLSMIGVGRVIAVFNHFTRDKLVKAAGVEI